MHRTHIFLDHAFSHQFQEQVYAQNWTSEFPKGILLDSFTLDSKLYTDDAIFRKRRERLIPWMDNPYLWNKTVIGACEELAISRPGIHSKVLEDIHVLEALKDFVDHLHFFYMVATVMSSQGHSFQPVSQYSTNIHDLDKLHPMMLLGYSEKFEDNVSTSVWDMCVERHVHVNPHHQIHSIWHGLDTRTFGVDDITCLHCDETSSTSRHLYQNDIAHNVHKKDIIIYEYSFQNNITCKCCSVKNDSLQKIHELCHNCTKENTRSRHVEDVFCGHCSENGAISKRPYEAETSYSKENDVNTKPREDYANYKYDRENDTDCKRCNECLLLHQKEWGIFGKDIRTNALREMVCDKVSRRLQKTLNGVVSDTMWDVDEVYFEGLPDKWMGKARVMMKELKKSTFVFDL